MIRLFRTHISVGVFTLLISEIILVSSLFILATYFVLDVDPTVFLLYDGGLVRILVVLLSILLGFHFEDLYTRIKVKSKMVLFQQLCEVLGAALLIQALISYLIPALVLPRWVMLIGASMTLAVIPLWRQFYSNYVLQMVGTQKVMFVGSNPVVEEMAEHIGAHPELSFEVVGYALDHQPENRLSGGPVLGRIDELPALAARVKPDLIVVGMSERRARMPVAELLELRFSGYRIEEASTTYETVCGRICTKELRPGHLIFSTELGPNEYGFRVQVLLNILLASVGVVLASPVMLITALVVRLSSPGPVLFSQTRVGFNGVPFRLYKFRSMRADAEKRTGAVWATRNDPRVTSAGRWLRKLRIDELPQLFNVLKGEMSIVGPRPERPEFVDTLSKQIPFYRQRHAVKPGITGWAQIHHKYGDTIEDTIIKLEYDLYYIKHVSFSLDLYIIFHTLKTMALLRGGQ